MAIALSLVIDYLYIKIGSLSIGFLSLLIVFL